MHGQRRLINNYDVMIFYRDFFYYIQFRIIRLVIMRGGNDQGGNFQLLTRPSRQTGVSLVGIRIASIYFSYGNVTNASFGDFKNTKEKKNPVRRFI